MAILEPTKKANTLEMMHRIRGRSKLKPTKPPMTPATEPIVGAVERAGSLVAGIPGLAEETYRYLGMEGVADVYGGLREKLEPPGRYQANVPWEEVKKVAKEKGLSFETVGTVLQFGLETGAVSMPDMLWVIANLPSYVMARTGELLKERKANKGGQLEAEDFGIALAGAGASAYLERLGVRGILGGPVGGAVKEAGTEAIQEGGIEYATTRAGTDAPMSLEEAADLGLAGAVGGGVFGAAAGTVAGAVGGPQETLDQMHKIREEADKFAKDESGSVPDPANLITVGLADNPEKACAKCFEWVYKNKDVIPGAKIVHGTVKPPMSDKTIEHAWIETPDGKVLDQQTMELGLSKFAGEGWPKDIFYETYKPKNIESLSSDEAMKKAVQAGHYGPFGADGDQYFNEEVLNQQKDQFKPKVLKRDVRGRPIKREPLKTNWFDKVSRKLTEEKRENISKNYKFVHHTGSVEGKTFYHGTKRGLKSLEDTDILQYGDPNALLGPGLYLTDHPGVAKGYSRTKPGKGEGRVLSVSLKDTKLIDMDMPLPADVQKVFNSYLDIFMDVSEGGPLTTDIGGVWYNSLTDEMGYAQTDMGEAVGILGDLQAELQELGYHGFKHIGGVISEGAKHNVVILWDTGLYDTKTKKMIYPLKDRFQSAERILR